jgi:pre-60S factor REI1
LKRREAGLPLLEETEFQTRWEAALALRQENDKKNKTAGTDHIKNDKKKAASQKKKERQEQEQNKQKKNKKYQHKNYSTNEITNDDNDKMKEDNDDDGVDPNEAAASKPSIPAALAESQENPDIDPKQSLFDPHRSQTLKENVEYMQRNYGFFVPDSECLVDLEGLLGYCHEKIKLGHYCLYCEK